MEKTTTQLTTLNDTRGNLAFMKWLLFFGILLGIQNSFAQKTWDGGAFTNNWGDANNWSGNSLPSSTDNVVIGNGANVLLNVDDNIASLTIGGGTSGSLTLSGNQNRTLTVSGSVTVNSGATLTASGNSGHTLNIGGNFSNAGTFTDNASDMNVIFNGSSQTISGAGSFTFTDFLFSTAGTKTINSSITVTDSWTNNGGTVGGTGTVTLSGGTQAVGGSSSTMAFHNLILSGGTKTFNKPVVVSGNLSIASGALANFGSSTTNTAATLTLGGVGTATGKFGSTSTTGTAPVYKNNTYFTAGTTGYITVATSGCVAPTITFGSIPSICQGAVSLSLPYTATTGSPNLYSITGTGITSVTNGTLPASPITVGLSSPAAAGTISSTTFTVSNSVTGCVSANINGSVIVNPTVATPSFTAGSVAECQDAADETYTATATNTTGITYSVSPAGAGTIGSTSGVMNWSSSFSGNATITASAAGCSGPKTVDRVVVVTGTLATPTFTAGSTSVCQDAANTTYTATAANNTGITYSVSPAGAGTIGASNGIMDWNPSFTGSATITASATGCGGPKTVDRVVTVIGYLELPIFTAGSTAVCQDAANETYVATAVNATGPVTYNFFPSGVGTMSSSTGVMNWNASFSGTATIYASANGCNGPLTASRNVIVTPSVGTPSFNAGDTSVCQDAADETYTATAANNTGITYSVSPAAAGTINTGNGLMDWNPSFSGTATITASATGCNGPKTANRNVTVTATVGTPSFSFGPSTVCQNASTSTYSASASNDTGITFSVSPAAAGSMTNVFGLGFMNWSSTFSGTATITATATGCNGPKSTNLSVTVTPTVGTPSFTAGAATVCQDAADETYTATATDDTGITYSVSPAAAGAIGTSSGIMNWSPSFTGTATITASASGCNGPKTASISVTVTPTVGTPAFTSGATTVCQDTADTTYAATATNTTAISFSVLPAAAGTIGASTGIMNWDAGFSGNATITASAAGCNGPKTIIRVVTVTPTVGTPTFTAGATTICQNAADEIYTATATNSTGITYSVSPGSAGSIDFLSGNIDWSSTFSGTATITASASGCNGPILGTRVVTVTPTVGTPGFTAGPITVCQDAADTAYAATASNATGITYSVSPAAAGTIDSTTGIMNWDPSFNGSATITATAAGCNGPSSSNRIVTVNALPVVTAQNVSGCSGSPIALSGSGLPVGGSGNYSVANPYVGADTTYTYTYTDGNGCTNTSNSATITNNVQPLWYLDADGDQYYTGSAISSCTSPGTGYATSGLLGGGDCDDNSTIFNPGATDICYNNIDENCDNVLSNGCAPVVVNMTASYHNTTLPSLSTAVPAVSYTYLGETNLKYRFSITNVTTGTTAPDVIQTSRYVTIPASIHSYNSQYTITVSAVINEEIVPFAGNTITVNSPNVQLISLNTTTCGTTLSSLASTITANPGLNATGYIFRIRLNDGNPTPTYATSPSVTRFVGANSFTGFPLQYLTSYKVSVQYSFIDPVTNLPVVSGYGAECTVNTPSIPVTNLASPVCGSQVAVMNANISAAAAPNATAYRFRIRLFTDNGPTPTYYYSLPNASRFSSLTAFQGITLAYSTPYLISVEYSVFNGATTVWSGYGSECKVTMPFFPTTSLVSTQCGQMTPTSLTQQLNVTPYPGFPHYKILLEEIQGEDVVTFEEREISYSYFKLSDFSIAQPGKSYAVSVAIKLNGVFGNYDTACDLFTAPADVEGGVLVKANIGFKAAAYPNPFADNFMLDVKTGSQSAVNLKVYDMIGRLIEQRDISVSDLENVSLGNNYPSGVYNIIVTQEDNVQTVRVVKR